jgi:prepilin-type processing-associated H-X9-DG protein
MNSQVENRAQADITQTSLTPMFFDGTAASTTGPSSQISDGLRHFEGANICYVDGHVKFQNRGVLARFDSWNPAP